MSKSDTPVTNQAAFPIQSPRKSGTEDVVLVEVARELERHGYELDAENNTLRALLGNSALPCTYCGLPAADQAKCARGFPGCARADDQSLSAHFAAGWAAEEAEKESAELRRERDELADALRELVRVADRYPVCPIGHVIEHGASNARALLARIKEGKR